MEEIDFSYWKKLEIVSGKIISCERVPKTEKLYKLKVDIGEKTIQIITSLVPYYSIEEIMGKNIIVLKNLKKAKFGGEISEGMLLCAESEDGKTCVLLSPEKEVPPGTRVT
jgi:tRNA-binding protein